MIKIDFTSDWLEIVLNRLRRYVQMGRVCKAFEKYENGKGSMSPKQKEASEMALAYLYFDYIMRIPAATPRILKRNPEFKCPHEYQGGWAMIQSELRRGVDMTPRMSRAIEKVGSKDSLFYDWGVCHFHLGTTWDKKHSGLYAGGNDVLFIVITARKFFPLFVGKHGDWSDFRMQRLMHKYFPDVLNQGEMKGCKALSWEPTEEDVKQLREQGLNCATRVDEKFYMSPGGGINMSGGSAAATFATLQARKQVRMLEQIIRGLMLTPFVKCDEEICVRLVDVKRKDAIVSINGKQRTYPISMPLSLMGV